MTTVHQPNYGYLWWIYGHNEQIDLMHKKYVNKGPCSYNAAGAGG